MEVGWLLSELTPGLDHLKKQTVSQSSAMQRAGRAGREVSRTQNKLTAELGLVLPSLHS